MRNLWFSKLCQLEQPCAPDLAPHIDPATLSVSELRSIVVTAFRRYWLMMKGPTCSAGYTPTKTVVAGHPNLLGGDDRLIVLSVKIVPGKRFLFIHYFGQDYSELRLLDLEHGDRCIWSFNPSSTCGGLHNSRTIASYDFEFRRDGSALLALSLFESLALRRCRAIVLRLDLSGAPTGAVEESIVASTEVADFRRDAYPDFCTVSAKFAAFALAMNSIIIVDCEEKNIASISLSESNTWTPRDLQIWDDHLFYVDASNDTKRPLCAFSLAQVMSSPSPSTSFVVENSLVSCLDPITREDNEPDNLPKSMAFSLYNPFNGNNAQTVTATIIGIRYVRYLPQLIVLRAVLDKTRQCSEKWTRISFQSVFYPLGNIVPHPKVFLHSKLSRSGRVLVLLSGPGLPDGKDYRLVAIDRQGRLVFPNFSESIYPVPRTRSRSRKREPSDMSPPDVLQPYMEPYSGMVIKLKSRESRQDAIELYCPA